MDLKSFLEFVAFQCEINCEKSILINWMKTLNEELVKGLV
jgi:hypothetical protein